MSREQKDTNIYISLQYAAQLCKYTQEYLSLRARQGKLKAVKRGRNWRTTKEWLDGYIETTTEFKRKQAKEIIQNATERMKQAAPPENLPCEFSQEIIRESSRGDTSLLKDFWEMLRQTPSFQFAGTSVATGLLLIGALAYGYGIFPAKIQETNYIVQNFSEGFETGSKKVANESWRTLFRNGFENQDSNVPAFRKFAERGAAAVNDIFSMGENIGRHAGDQLQESFGFGAHAFQLFSLAGYDRSVSIKNDLATVAHNGYERISFGVMEGFGKMNSLAVEFGEGFDWGIVGAREGIGKQFHSFATESIAFSRNSLSDLNRNIQLFGDGYEASAWHGDHLVSTLKDDIVQDVKEMATGFNENINSFGDGYDAFAEKVDANASLDALRLGNELVESFGNLNDAVQLFAAGYDAFSQKTDWRARSFSASMSENLEDQIVLLQNSFEDLKDSALSEHSVSMGANGMAFVGGIFEGSGGWIGKTLEGIGSSFKQGALDIANLFGSQEDQVPQVTPDQLAQESPVSSDAEPTPSIAISFSPTPAISPAQHLPLQPQIPSPSERVIVIQERTPDYFSLISNDIQTELQGIRSAVERIADIRVIQGAQGPAGPSGFPGSQGPQGPQGPGGGGQTVVIQNQSQKETTFSGNFDQLSVSHGKLTVDASGNLTTDGGVTAQSLSMQTLSVTGNTTIGDASGDTLTINAATIAVPNSLSVDSATLYIDSSNNRVGIGTSSPSVALDVAGNLKVSGTSTLNGVAYTWPSADGSSGQTLTTNASGTLSWTTITSGSTDAQYVVLAASGDLSSERVLTGTANQITVTDAGAGGNVTLSLPQSIATTSAVAFATIDTGQGANELYDMDQNVLTTSSPTFAGLTLSGNATLQDDALGLFGTGGDIAFVNRSLALGANTALASVLIGTPVTAATPANSLLVSNITADGDMAWFLNDGSGNSWEYLRFDGSADSVIFNEAGSDIDFRVESDGNANALTVDAGLFSGVGQLSIGSAAQSTATGFTVIDNPAITATSNQNFYKLLVDNSAAVTVAGATTSAIVASLAIDEPNITATGTVTDAVTLYIQAAPTEGGTGNYALWVDEGTTRLDGNLGIGAASPFVNFASASGDFSSHTGIHLNDGTTTAAVAIEGATGAKLILGDNGGGANDKIIEYEVDGGVGTFRTLNDDLTTLVDNMLTFDITRGRVGIFGAADSAGTGGVLKVTAPGSGAGTGIEIVSSNGEELSFTGSSSGNIGADYSLTLDLDDNNDEADAPFTIRNGGDTEIFRFSEVGRLGIGDNGPDNLLDIISATAAAGLAITSTGTDTDVYINFELTDGTPNFVMGVDDSDNDTFKIGTTAVETSTVLTIDSRTTTSGVSAITLAGIAPTIASATGAEYTTLTITPPTVTLTGTTQVTSQMDSVLISAPTITDASAVTVDRAATLTISAGPTASGSLLIANDLALSVVAGNIGFGANSMLAWGAVNDKLIDDMEVITDWTESENGVTDAALESTIVKTEAGAMKITTTAGSSNSDTIKKDMGFTADLSSVDRVGLWIRGTETGQIISVQFSEDDSTYQDHNITILKKDVWQYEEWDISGITGTSRDFVQYYRFVIDDDTSSPTFYIDQLRFYDKDNRAAEMYVDGSGRLQIAGNQGLELTANIASGNPGVSLNGTTVTLNQPLSVAVGGDVGIDYDLQFLNTGISSITSEGSLQILAGDANHAENLTLGTQGTGDVVVDVNDADSTIGGFKVLGSGGYNFRVRTAGQVGFKAATELTIATGAVAMTQTYHTIDSEADAASDDLDTISGGQEGDVLVARASHTDRSVVLKDGTGNLQLSGDITLDNTQDAAILIYDGTNWLELSNANSGADVAESYYVEDVTVKPGDVVALDGVRNELLNENQQKERGRYQFVKKANTPYAKAILGVISTSPSVNLGGGYDKLSSGVETRPVALSGRVPVKISLENGEIEPGDYLTSSTTPGFAMKATRDGRVIGIALEAYNEEIKEQMETTRARIMEERQFALKRKAQKDAILARGEEFSEDIQNPIVVPSIPDSDDVITMFVNAHWAGLSFDEFGLLQAEGNEDITNEDAKEDGFTGFFRRAISSLTGTVQTSGNWVFGKITARTARVEKLELVDQQTGEVYCTWISNGEWEKVNADCDRVEYVNGQPVIADQATNYDAIEKANATPTPESTPSSSPSPEATLGPSSSPEPDPTPTAEPVPTPTLTPEPAPSPSPIPTPSPTPEPSPSVLPTPTAAPTPSISPSPEPTISPNATPLPSPQITPTRTPEPSPTPTPTPSPSPIPATTPAPEPLLTPPPKPSSTPSPPPASAPVPTLNPSPAPEHESEEDVP